MDQFLAGDIDHLFLTGPAGTGKTYTVNQICQTIGSDSILLCATTGVAANLINGKTLHNALRIEVARYSFDIARIYYPSCTVLSIGTLNNITTAYRKHGSPASPNVNSGLICRCSTRTKPKHSHSKSDNLWRCSVCKQYYDRQCSECPTPHTLQGDVLTDCNGCDPSSCFLAFIRKHSVIVIDEVSMLSSMNFDIVNHTLNCIFSLEYYQACVNAVQSSILLTNTDIFMGGMRVVLVGDIMQLPPIPSYDLRRSRDTFHKKPEEVIDPGLSVILNPNFRKFHVHYLTKIYRVSSDEEEYIRKLNLIRIGRRTYETLLPLTANNSQVTLYSPNNISIYFTKALADAHNKRILDKIKRESFTYKYSITLDINGNNVETDNVESIPNISLQHICKNYLRDSHIEHREFKEGCIVMVTRNLPKLELNNGHIAKVIELTPTSVTIIAQHNNKSYTIEAISTQINNTNVVVTHIPLMLANAITHCKSQGQTISGVPVIIHLPTNASRSMSYVTLSRVSSYKKLYIVESSPLFRIDDYQDELLVEYEESIAP